MNPTSKKLLSLFLVFSLMAISCASLRTTGGKREKHGAKLVIQRKSDQVEKTKLEGTPWETPVITGIRGELIAVKPNSLLLLDTEGKDVSVEIEEIKTIRIVKKSKARAGAGIGGAIGLGVGLYGIISSYNASVNRGEDGVLISYLLLGSLVVPVAAMVGGVIGGGVGALVRGDGVIYLTGMTDSEIKEALDYLRKKARIRDYR